MVERQGEPEIIPQFHSYPIEQAGVLETHLQAAEVALKPIKEDPVRKLNSDTFGLQEMQALEIEVRLRSRSYQLSLTLHS